MQSDPSYLVGDSLVTNYLVNINSTTNANLNFDEYNNFTKELKNFWLVCYKPNIDYACEIPENKNYNLVITKKYYQVESLLYKVK